MSDKRNDPAAGTYRTIVADPPWLYDYPGGPGHKAPWRIESADRYPRMRLEEICALDVRSLAAPGAHLYIWAVLPILNRVFEVIDAWGFEREPTTTITWGKPGPGLGRGWRSSTEFLVCARDRRRRPYLGTHPGTLVMAPRGAHSAKPEVFQDLIEHMSPGPYLEMFARRPRDGWDVWGNEIPNDVEVAADPRARLVPEGSKGVFIPGAAAVPPRIPARRVDNRSAFERLTDVG